MQGIKLNNKILLDKDGNIIVLQKTFTNLNNGIGNGSIQQFHALATGTDASALGASDIKYTEDGEYNTDVVFKVGDTSNPTESSLTELPESIYEPYEGDDDDSPAINYLDDTEFLNLHDIIFKTTGAFGDYAHSEGYHTIASGQHSHAEGALTYANGVESHAEGYKNLADGRQSHAEGFINIVRGQASHVEGMSNIVLSQASHAEGYNNHMDGVHSHVEGVDNIVRAGSAHAEGYHNAIAHGANSSHVSGANNIVNENHYNSFVAGYNNQTSAPNQTVVGKYNADNEDALFIVGVGDSTTRSNALEVTKDLVKTSNLECNNLECTTLECNTFKVTEDPIEETDVPNKKYVDNFVQDLYHHKVSLSYYTTSDPTKQNASTLFAEFICDFISPSAIKYDRTIEVIEAILTGKIPEPIAVTYSSNDFIYMKLLTNGTNLVVKGVSIKAGATTFTVSNETIYKNMYNNFNFVQSDPVKIS